MKKNNKLKILLNHIVTFTKIKIKELAKTELNSKEKKQKLDDYIVNLIRKTMNYLHFNIAERWFVEHYIIPIVDDITQYIYDLIKIKWLQISKMPIIQ